MNYRYLISIVACTAALTLSACGDNNNEAPQEEAAKPAASIDTTIEGGTTEGIATTGTTGTTDTTDTTSGTTTNTGVTDTTANTDDLSDTTAGTEPEDL